MSDFFGAQEINVSNVLGSISSYSQNLNVSCSSGHKKLGHKLGGTTEMYYTALREK